LNNFLDLPGGGAGGGRPGTPSTRPAGGNAAVADFLGGKGAGVAAGAGAGIAAGAVGRGPAAGTRDLAGGDRAANRADTRESRVASRGDMRSSLSENRGDRRTQRQEQLGDRADSIRNQMNEHFDQNHLFDNFWQNHPHAHYRFDQNPLFWTWATFATVSAFMPWNWGSPAYYDYGSGGNVTYADDTVQANGETYTAEEYAQQAEDLATSAPEEPVQDPEWLPLGVFAMTQDGESPTLPNMFLQLAVSKEGIIAGTYQNKTTGKTQSMEGMVDKTSQRAAWTVVGKNTPIMETGISNLTMNETKALIHFADGSTQQWLMVRIEKPKDAQ